MKQNDLRTFDEWNAAGYRVHKGERASAHDERGALFARSQVWFPDEEDSDVEAAAEEQQAYEASRL